MSPIVLHLPGNDGLAAELVQALGAEPGLAEVRHFPDGESYVRVATATAGRPVFIAATLDRPDKKLLPLLLLAATVRELGATSVGLIAPYLPYLRQDRRFRDGEAVSARHFARLLSTTVDWVVTMDPHLHRVHRLDEIYTIPAATVHAAPRLARWISEHVPQAVVVGPDEESRQWVDAVARAAGVPAVVCRKQRVGDYRVMVELPDLSAYRDRTPVVVDDVISTGRSMVQTVRALRDRGLPAPHCLAVHGIFAAGAYPELLGSGVASIVTCNTVPHCTNAIDVGDLLAAAAARMVGLTVPTRV